MLKDVESTYKLIKLALLLLLILIKIEAQTLLKGRMTSLGAEPIPTAAAAQS